MNDELSFVRDARPEIDAPSLSELAVARHELQRAIRQESRKKTTGRHAAFIHPDTSPGRSRPRQFSLRLGAVVVAASFITAAILIVPQSSRTGLGAPLALADPLAVLHSAASNARSQPDIAPRPDQYYYVRTGTQQIWYSIDGHHPNGERDNAQRNVAVCASSAQSSGNNALPVCDVGPAYDPTMPTDPEAMTEYIRQRVRSDLLQYVEPGRAEEEISRWAGGFVQKLLETQYLRAPIKAALYEAITEMMTVKLMTENVPAGTVGVSFDDDTSALLFSTATHDYVGYLSTDSSTEGTSLDEYASGLVDRVGQTP